MTEVVRDRLQSLSEQPHPDTLPLFVSNSPIKRKSAHIIDVKYVNYAIYILTILK
jgi:hypothetical protein